MPFNRRSFLNKLGLGSASMLLSNLSNKAWSKDLNEAIRLRQHKSPGELAQDEEFWYYIQQAFTVSSGIINLNNGGVSPAPKTVQDAMKRNYDFSNEAPSYFMWRVLDQGRESVRAGLARLARCDKDEIAINRNSSEGLETVIFGLQLKPGDEVVASRQDYPNVINALKQRETREGIKINWINLELPSTSENYLVKKYTGAFTDRTKAVLVTHIINWNGQIIPVRKIADEARRRGIAVIVDGAHSFAHLEFSISELNCDYYATSLHKWLYAPIGSGMLYVRKENISKLYPLFATDTPLKDDVRKFEHLGTRPFFIEQAIGKAIEFHDMIGIKRKQARLHYLKDYWMSKIKNLPGVELHTSTDPSWGCAIGMISVKDKKGSDLDNFLFSKYKIHAVNIEWENIRGVRITPNVYTTTQNLDLLVQGIREFVRS